MARIHWFFFKGPSRGVKLCFVRNRVTSRHSSGARWSFAVKRSCHCNCTALSLALRNVMDARLFYAMVPIPIKLLVLGGVPLIEPLELAGDVKLRCCRGDLGPTATRSWWSRPLLSSPCTWTKIDGRPSSATCLYSKWVERSNLTLASINVRTYCISSFHSSPVSPSAERSFVGLNEPALNTILETSMQTTFTLILPWNPPLLEGKKVPENLQLDTHFQTASKKFTRYFRSAMNVLPSSNSHWKKLRFCSCRT